MRACGICGSDLHIIEGTTLTATLPIVLGHEAAGIVYRIGPAPEGAAATLAVGDRVAFNPMIGCGSCRLCATGGPNYCPRIRILGLHVDGAHADLVVVPAANLVRLPDTVGFPVGAIVADAIATPLRAIVSADVERGTPVAVFGLGGLGLHAAMLLDQIFGAEVIGVDVSEAKLERAASFGVRTVVDARHPRVADEIKRITGEGVTASFEFVGAVPVVEQAVRSLAHNGTCVVVGVGPDRLRLSLRQEPRRSARSACHREPRVRVLGHRAAAGLALRREATAGQQREPPVPAQRTRQPAWLCATPPPTRSAS